MTAGFSHAFPALAAVSDMPSLPPAKQQLDATDGDATRRQDDCFVTCRRDGTCQLQA